MDEEEQSSSAQDSPKRYSKPRLTEKGMDSGKPLGAAAEAARAYREQMKGQKRPKMGWPSLRGPSTASATGTKDFLWGCLGTIAATNESLARTSINLISCNLILWFALFVVVFYAVANASHSFHWTGIIWGLLWLLASVPISFIVLGGIIAIGTGSTVFRKEAKLVTEPPADAEEHHELSFPAHVQVTGNFRLEGKHAERFVCMPADLRQTNAGSLCAYIRVDASQKFSGITIARREGVWTVEIFPWLILEMDTGTQYWDSGSYPAIRLSHHRGLWTEQDFDDIDFQHEIILAFSSKVERQHFINACRIAKRPILQSAV